MNQTKVQYAIIAHKELMQAKQKVDFWSAHLSERLETLNDAEITEFKKRAGEPAVKTTTRRLAALSPSASAADSHLR